MKADTLEERVLRAVTHLLLSSLLLVSFVWGGCISCEQYFMWPGAKSCCGSNGSCKTKTPAARQNYTREYKQIAVDHQKSVDFHIDLPVFAIVASDLPPRIAEPLTGWSGLHPVAPSPPPDLQALHSTFLI
jgi:hypothetical protein